MCQVGDYVAVKGPMGAITYLGRSVFTVHNCSRLVEKVSMVAGGTGITPLYQVMRAGVLDPEDKTQFYLIYANRSIDQILLRKELEELAKMAPDRYAAIEIIGAFDRIQREALVHGGRRPEGRRGVAV